MRLLFLVNHGLCRLGAIAGAGIIPTESRCKFLPACNVLGCERRREVDVLDPLRNDLPRREIRFLPAVLHEVRAQFRLTPFAGLAHSISLAQTARPRFITEWRA